MDNLIEVVLLVDELLGNCDQCLSLGQVDSVIRVEELHDSSKFWSGLETKVVHDIMSVEGGTHGAPDISRPNFIHDFQKVVNLAMNLLPLVGVTSGDITVEDDDEPVQLLCVWNVLHQPSYSGVRPIAAFTERMGPHVLADQLGDLLVVLIGEPAPEAVAAHHVSTNNLVTIKNNLTINLASGWSLADVV